MTASRLESLDLRDADNWIRLLRERPTRVLHSVVNMWAQPTMALSVEDITLLSQRLAVVLLRPISSFRMVEDGPVTGSLFLGCST